MVNKVILVGRLGKDPEIHYTPDGTMITNFTIATSEQWKDKNGEKVQKTEWHQIVAYRKLAEICGNYLVKGKLVFIEGRIQTRSWEDKEGIKRYITEIIAGDMKMLDSRGHSPPFEGQNKTGDSSFDASPGGINNGGDIRPPSDAQLDDVPF